MRFVFYLAALAPVAAAQPSLPARAWDSYQVIMWSTGNPVDRALWLARLGQLGITAEECAGCSAAPYAPAGLGFYLENLVPELGFLNSRQPIYQADWNGYAAPPHDKQYLIRKPSLNDPGYWDAAIPRLQSLVRPYVVQQPLLYQLRDELSIGSYANPMDYDFDPHALAAFRQWLQSAYGSLDALNLEWDTSFSSWDDVLPLDTYEIKDRERAALAAKKPENYAPWADHRAFMDLTLAQSVDRLRATIRGLDASTPVGIEGTQMPSAWGGFDLWRLSRAVDWVEPYDIAGARDIWRSFLPQGTTVLTTVFGDDFPHIRQRLWWLLLNGDRGAIIWDDDTGRVIGKDQADMPVTDRGLGLAAIIAEMKSAAPGVFALHRLDDRIAIHYSQPSIRAHWMFDSREDGNTWPRRFSSYEAVHSRLARVRDSFMRVIDDLGLSYNFVSYEQIESGELLDGGYRVLLLPQSVAMSAVECRRIEEFVRAGGTVIADNMTATMDEHGRRLAAGQLDNLFGIRRFGVGWRAQAAGGSLGEFAAFEPDISAGEATAQQESDSGVPAFLLHQVGDGLAVYLNIDMHDYGRLRLNPPGGAAYRDLFAGLLAGAGIVPPLRIVSAADGAPVPCLRVWRFAAADGTSTFAVMRNPEFSAAALQSIGYPDNSRIEVPVRIRVSVPPGDAYLEMDLDPWSPAIFTASLSPVGRTIAFCRLPNVPVFGHR